MNEIKLRPGEEFVYNGIRFICLDIIGGNYLAITADCWCEKRFNDNYNDRHQTLLRTTATRLTERARTI